MLDATSAVINDGEANGRSPLLGGEGRSWRDWARTYRWYIAAGVGVGLAVTAVATGCGVYFGLLAAPTPAAGNTTATPTTPDFTPTTASSSVGPTGSTQLSTFSIPVNVSSSTGPTSSGTVTMSTTTTNAPGSSTTSSLCTSIDDKYGMELEMLKRNAVAGKETRVGNFEFGDTGLATIKVEGLKTGDVVKAVSAKTGAPLGSKTATSGEILEMDTFLRRPGDTSVDVLIEPANKGSSVTERNTVFTGTRGQGVVTCPLDLRVEPKPKSAQRQRRNAHAFHGRTSAARAAAAEAAAGVAAAG